MATASVIENLNVSGMYGAARPQQAQAKEFGRLSRECSEALNKLSARQTFREGELIYTEGELSTGAYIVGQGKVKLVANSCDGKALILRIAGPGEIISLSAALSQRANDTSALVVEPTVVSYIKSQVLYQLMQRFGDFALRLAHELSNEYSLLCQELSTLGLQRSAMSRLAKLLVGMTENAAPQGGKVRLKCALTHEEMAQMIGTSRETVTRLLHDLRDQNIAVLKHDVLTITKPDSLRNLTN